ncbi:MAG TPA: hypothetical protein PK733_01240 [Clostridiales bacterium]|nr:hypothetical protein [Clostridiales bacterium]
MQGKFEVIGHKEILSFVQERRPHLVSFDGQRAYTSRPEALAEYVYKIKGSFNKYRLLFIPA